MWMQGDPTWLCRHPSGSLTGVSSWGSVGSSVEEDEWKAHKKVLSRVAFASMSLVSVRMRCWLSAPSAVPAQPSFRRMARMTLIKRSLTLMSGAQAAMHAGQCSMVPGATIERSLVGIPGASDQNSCPLKSGWTPVRTGVCRHFQVDQPLFRAHFARTSR